MTFSQFKRIYEKKSSDSKRLYEWMTIADLNTKDATSDFTKRKRAIRTSLYKGENVTSRIVKGSYDRNEDAMTFEFVTTATIKAHPAGSEFKRTDPFNNFNLIPNPDRKYHMYVKVLNFMEWLRGTRPEQLSESPITDREILDVLNSAYVQLFCDDPSFQYQTANYTLSQVDASIYPTNIAPKKWNKVHGDYNFLCKHLKGLLDQIGFFLPQMASIANQVIQKEGL